VKRLLALLAGGLGLRALLRRRSRPAFELSPAEDLRSRLAEARSAEPELAPAPEVVPSDVAERRAGVHDRARAAIEELREPDEPA
jgi:broad specificity phosphatase PhoE